MSTLVISILSAFTVLSILHQFRPLQPHLRKRDKLGLLPNYSFFAPKPMTSDYRLIYKRAGGDDAEWVEVPICTDAGLSRLVWNPDKYVNKAFVDTCNFLIDEFHRLPEKPLIRISLHYLTLMLTVARHLGRSRQQGHAVRFAVVSTGGGDRVSIEQVMFASSNQVL